MPIQRSIRQFPERVLRYAQSAILTLFLFLMLAAGLPAGAVEEVELGLDQARDLAIQALYAGDPGLAITLAKGLLKADPKDPSAYFIIATGYAQLNDPVLARRAAGYAYRNSKPGPARFEAAQLAAKMSFDSGNYNLSQLWLRRTAIHAPTEQDELSIARDYKLLRRVNPWSLRFRTDARPSNNVNNGSDTALNIIDGVPDESFGTGRITPSSQALSGLIGSLDIAPSYRLRINETSATYLNARLYVTGVALSSEAKRDAPNARGSDYNSTYGELSLTHAFAAGPEGRGGQASVNFALGESWYGGERNYRFGRLQANRSWRMAAGNRLRLRAEGEQRFDASSTFYDARILVVGGEVSRVLDNGDQVELTLALRDSDAQSINNTFSSASMRASYTMDNTVGPARLSLGLVLGYSDYDAYLACLCPASPRTDKSFYGDVTLIFDQYDYAGFVPTLRFRGGRKKSNFSLFSSRELSVSLGLGSKF